MEFYASLDPDDNGLIGRYTLSLRYTLFPVGQGVYLSASRLYLTVSIYTVIKFHCAYQIKLDKICYNNYVIFVYLIIIKK